jgi:predicted SnoaL-like aldol condensation-catalyzing enzyme
MASDLEEKNKALVLMAFDTLLNKRDYPTAEQFWSPQYIQHSAHIAPGRQGLFDLIKSLPPTLKYEAGTIVAEGNFVICARTVFGIRRPCKLDRYRHLTHRGRNTRRTLGCDSGRGHRRAIEKRRTHVRKDFSKIQMKRSG